MESFGRAFRAAISCGSANAVPYTLQKAAETMPILCDRPRGFTSRAPEAERRPLTFAEAPNPLRPAPLCRRYRLISPATPWRDESICAGNIPER